MKKTAEKQGTKEESEDEGGNLINYNQPLNLLSHPTLFWPMFSQTNPGTTSGDATFS